MKSADAIVQALLEENVKVIFGIPGFLTINLYDVLYNTNKIRHVLVRHEHAAAFMAYGYGMVTGTPGTCFVIDGPGVTNMTTGIADANTASLPMVVIVGKIPGGHFGRGAAHELDSTFLKPITKKIIRISEPNEIATAVHEAYTTAASGKKGPVCLEIPVDLMAMNMPPEQVDRELDSREDLSQIPESDIRAAAKLLTEAKQPIILAGGGAMRAGANQELTQLAELLGIPVVVSHMARGVIPDDHPLALGLIKNNPTLVDFIQQSDVVLAVGLKFSQVLTFNWTLKIPPKLIQIDIDSKQIGKNYPVATGIAGDAKVALRQLLDCLGNEVQKRRTEAYPRFSQVTKWKKLIKIGKVSECIPIKPLRLIKSMRDCLDRDAIITTDVGNSFFWALFFMEIYQPQTLLCSSSYSAMGCGLPLAIGAKIAEPEKQVVCLTGDGGFLMNDQELATAVENKLAIPIVIMNDSGYGAIRHIQDRLYNGRHMASNWVSPEFVQIGKGFGADAALIEKPDDIEPALRAALNADKPTVLDVRVDGSEKLPRNRLPSEN
jgi:acetolactate synthase-1/2/3 large subunit